MFHRAKLKGEQKALSGSGPGVDAVYGVKQTGRAGGHATGSTRELDGVYRPISKKAVRANVPVARCAALTRVRLNQSCTYLME